MAIVNFLIIAWVLSWFKFNKLFIQAFKELFKFEIRCKRLFCVPCTGILGDIILFFQGTYEMVFLNK